MMLLHTVVTAALLATQIGMQAGQSATQDDAQSAPPQTAQCYYYKNNARFDTCACGAVADDACVRLRMDDTPQLILIDGSATEEEREGIEVKRAENAWSYFVFEKGVDPSRIILRWNRVARKSIGKWGGTLRILVLRPGQWPPDFVESDVAWQAMPR